MVELELDLGQFGRRRDVGVEMPRAGTGGDPLIRLAWFRGTGIVWGLPGDGVGVDRHLLEVPLGVFGVVGDVFLEVWFEGGDVVGGVFCTVRAVPSDALGAVGVDGDVLGGPVFAALGAASFDGVAMGMAFGERGVGDGFGAGDGAEGALVGQSVGVTLAAGVVVPVVDAHDGWCWCVFGAGFRD